MSKVKFKENSKEPIIDVLTTYGKVITSHEYKTYMYLPFWFNKEMGVDELSAYSLDDKLPDDLERFLNNHRRTLPTPNNSNNNYLKDVTQADHDNLADIAWFITGALSIAKASGLEYNFCQDHVDSLNHFMQAFKEYKKDNNQQ